MPFSEDDPETLAIIVTPHFNLATTTGFIDPFRAANYLEGKTLYRWRLFSLEGGPVEASNGMTIDAEPLASIKVRPDLVVISSSWAPEQYAHPLIHGALRRWARQGATTIGLDTGAFLLAGAGLLSGRRATVHYEHYDAFEELARDVEVCTDLFVVDGPCITCCGGGASVDLALQIIRERHGAGLSNSSARYIFHERSRPPGAQQNPGLIEPLGGLAPEKLRRAIAVMEANLEDPLTIPEICAGVDLSQRQLERLFQQYVRTSPKLYYRDIRLDRARGLVTQTTLPLKEVAIACGFASQEHFSRVYRARFGVTPSTDRVEGRVRFEFRAWPMHRPGAHSDAP